MPAIAKRLWPCIRDEPRRLVVPVIRKNVLENLSATAVLAADGVESILHGLAGRDDVVQLYNVASEMPCLRARSAVFAPALVLLQHVDNLGLP
jgi:hypothetical protein